MATESGAAVLSVEGCRLLLGDQGWEFADAHADDIEAHWERRLEDNPGFFNGTIYLTRGAEVEDGVLSARVFATEFKNFLYWRETGYIDRSVTDVFGSALIVSADGAVILGRQREGHINAGLAYCPGGLVDMRDVLSDGSVDILGSIRRELVEETGLTTSSLVNVPGFLVTRLGQQMSVAAEFRSPLGTALLTQRIADYLDADPQSELADVVAIASIEEAASVSMPSFMHPLLRSYFGGQRPGVRDPSHLLG
jgi:8-oxo-dGTP pyrophosphatase MutT (NUDIX family)